MTTMYLFLLVLAALVLWCVIGMLVMILKNEDTKKVPIKDILRGPFSFVDFFK